MSRFSAVEKVAGRGNILHQMQQIAGSIHALSVVIALSLNLDVICNLETDKVKHVDLFRKNALMSYCTM